MQQYELTLVLKPELTETQVDAIIKELNLKVTHKASWGKRLLAYQIKNYQEGLYEYLEVEIDAKQFAKLNQTLNVHEDILRYLLIRPEEGQAK